MWVLSLGDVLGRVLQLDENRGMVFSDRDFGHPRLETWTFQVDFAHLRGWQRKLSEPEGWVARRRKKGGCW